MSNQFMYDALPGRVLFSRGSARQQFAAEVDRLGWRRIMVVATKNGGELASEITAPCADRVAVRFDHALPHVPMTWPWKPGGRLRTTTSMGCCRIAVARRPARPGSSRSRLICWCWLFRPRTQVRR